ncbi:MAG: hypothetical protein AB3N16_10930, partial [Flavobacteriaceae bacterium]
LMAFLLLAHTHAQLGKRTDLLVDLVKQSDQALFASFAKTIPLGDSIQITTDHERSLDYTVKREKWGLYEKRTVRGKARKLRHVKTALVGDHAPKGLPTLYLKDRNRPLILAGKALVTGTAHLPKMGVKMGNIQGNSYTGGRLIHGPQRTSQSQLPSLDPETVAELERLRNGAINGRNLPFDPTQKEVRNSFHDPPLVLRDTHLRLADIQLAGNITILCDQKIVVESTAVLQDVILVAPEIIIKDWVRGQFQAFATKHIRVGKKCELLYPSALVLNQKNLADAAKTSDSGIYVDSYSFVGGTLMQLGTGKKKQLRPGITLEEHTKVLGVLYCEKDLELKGRVNGAVYTSGFLALENGNSYQNHLYNGQINAENLPYAYAGLIPDGNPMDKKTMQWLY